MLRGNKAPPEYIFLINHNLDTHSTWFLCDTTSHDFFNTHSFHVISKVLTGMKLFITQTEKDIKLHIGAV